MLPTQIGKYRILRSLGRGAMGDVYLGEDPLIGRQVAVKVLRQEDPEGRLRFLQEARVVGAFSHPNIVVVHEFGFEGDEPFLAMEFLPGQSLDEWLREPRPLAAQLRVVRGLAEALQYAHGQGVLHRDVKPGNVQVLPDGQCKLMDFGIARAALGRLTATGTVMGTPNYMAPETLSEATYSERSDLYSAAVVFWEMFAGRNPFAAPSVAACLHNVLHVEPEPLTRLRPDLPAALSSAVMECLAKDPARRPGSFARLLAAVQAAETGASAALPTTARDLPGETRALRVTARRRPIARRAFLGLAASLLLAVAGLWLATWQPATAPLPQPTAIALLPARTPPPPAATPVPEATSLPPAAWPTAAPGTPRPAAPRATPTPTAAPSAAPATPTPAVAASAPPVTLPSAPPSVAPSPRAAPTASPAPATPGLALSELKPRFVRRGGAVRLELRGSGFGPGLKLLVQHGGRPAAGLRVAGLRVLDASRATATVVADEDVALDTYVVVATDGDATSNGLTLEVQL